MAARSQWLATLLMHAVTSRTAASPPFAAFAAAAAAAPRARATCALAFSILCRTRQPSRVLFSDGRGAVGVRRRLSSHATQKEIGGAAGEGSCRGWGEDVWEEQLNIRHLEKAGARPQFFRTSCVFAPNKPADLIDTIVAERGVSVVLDLRSLDEMKTDVDSKFQTVVYRRDTTPSLETASILRSPLYSDFIW
jgi:hypothetical protein